MKRMGTIYKFVVGLFLVSSVQLSTVYSMECIKNGDKYFKKVKDTLLKYANAGYQKVFGSDKPRTIEPLKTDSEIMKAVKRNDIEQLKVLLKEEKRKIEEVLRGKGSRRAKEKKVQKLLRKGVDWQDQFADTPLIWATRFANYQAMQQLLKAGANPNISGRKGITPLLIAARKRFTNVIILLGLNGALRRLMEIQFFNANKDMDDAVRNKFKKDYDYITELKEDFNLSC
jgi:hypothetical protein